MAVVTNLLNPSRGCLRPFDVRRDLNGVADLVELCFSETLDQDGQRYLRQMRAAARNSSFLQWASAAVEQASLPLSGYIWEEAGCLVGNLSLIPFVLRGRRCYLIANVAVHPAYRRRGIARSLTSQALQHARDHFARSAWLHVRDDNDPALRLYLALGFQERSRRSTWHSLSLQADPSSQETLFLSPFRAPHQPVTVQRGSALHWPREQAWLRGVYPPEIAWHLPMNWNALQPGLWGGLYRLFSGMRVRHWVALHGERVLASLAWQSFHSHTDTLWLAAPAEADGATITALVQAARQELAPGRPLTLDYPAGRFVQDLRAAGFGIHHTLIWMEAPLS
jgi:GNAT superfamily N-acetyltransferase